MKKKTFTLTEEDATEIADDLRQSILPEWYDKWDDNLRIITEAKWEWYDSWNGKWNESVFYEVDDLISTSFSIAKIEGKIVGARQIEGLIDALEGELVGFEYEEESRLV